MTTKELLSNMRYRLPQSVIAEDMELLMHLNDAQGWLYRRATLDFPEKINMSCKAVLDEHYFITLPADCLRLLDAYYYENNRLVSLRESGYAFEMINKTTIRVLPSLESIKDKPLQLSYVQQWERLTLTNNPAWSYDFVDFVCKYAVVLFKRSNGIDATAEKAETDSVYEEIKGMMSAEVPALTQTLSDDLYNDGYVCRRWGW